MIRPILSFGDERLIQVSSSVDPTDLPGLYKWIEDLQDTLAEGMVQVPIKGRSLSGLTAVQIGIMKRICLLWFRDGGFRPLLNPTVMASGGDVTYSYENCFSILALRVRVPRPQWTTIRYQDPLLAWHEERFDGKASRLVLHEIDHTDGILCIHRMEKGDRPLTTAEYEALLAESSSPDSLAGQTTPAPFPAK